MFDFRAEVKGADQVVLRLRGFSGGDLTTLWPKIEADFYETEKRLFASRGSTGATGAWAPLSPAYAARKARTHPGRGILVREGDLRASLTGPSARGSFRRATSTSLTIGTSDPKAVYHKHGTSRMPARPPISVTPDDAKRWAEMAREWAVARLGGK